MNTVNVYIDIETIPDQTPGAIQDITETLTVQSPKLTKPELIEALQLGGDAKYKTVDELKKIWIDAFGHTARLEQAEQKWRKTSFDGLHGEVFCISWSVDGDGIANVCRGDTTTGDANIIEDFLKMLGNQLAGKAHTNTPFFIGHNITFDLKFLYRRCVVNNLPTPFKFNFKGRHNTDYFCTMQHWCEYGERIALDTLCKKLGIQQKGDIDGSQVWDYVKAGKYDEVADYCNDDVKRVIALHNRLLGI